MHACGGHALAFLLPQESLRAIYPNQRLGVGAWPAPTSPSALLTHLGQANGRGSGD